MLTKGKFAPLFYLVYVELCGRSNLKRNWYERVLNPLIDYFPHPIMQDSNSRDRMQVQSKTGTLTAGTTLSNPEANITDLSFVDYACLENEIIFNELMPKQREKRLRLFFMEVTIIIIIITLIIIIIIIIIFIIVCDSLSKYVVDCGYILTDNSDVRDVNDRAICCFRKKIERDFAYKLVLLNKQVREYRAKALFLMRFGSNS